MTNIDECVACTCKCASHQASPTSDACEADTSASATYETLVVLCSHPRRPTNGQHLTIHFYLNFCSLVLILAARCFASSRFLCICAVCASHLNSDTSALSHRLLTPSNDIYTHTYTPRCSAYGAGYPFFSSCKQSRFAHEPRNTF
jgi:hypothetical protein